MKKFGIALIVFGNILNLFSGASFKRKEVVLDEEDQKVTKELDSEVVCPPWAGMALILAGGIVYLAGLGRR